MSTSTSSRSLAGFTVVELLVGLSLTMMLAAAIAPVWLGWQRAFVRSADRTLAGLQGRVAAERLERDLRLASTLGCGDLGGVSILSADAHQVVFVSRTDTAGGTAELLEWEVTGNRLMRRTGRWPGAVPASFPHQLFSDNKTMIEGVSGSSRFTYYGGGVEVDPSDDRSSVDEVRLTGAVAGQSEDATSGQGAPLIAVARVGQ